MIIVCANELSSWTARSTDTPDYYYESYRDKVTLHRYKILDSLQEGCEKLICTTVVVLNVPCGGENNL